MNILNPILKATKITKIDVIKARVLLEKILRFKKIPIRPPIKTAKNNGKYEVNSFIIFSFVNCPKIPEIEFMRIKSDAVVTIFLGLSAFNRKSIGLKNIPPPIPIKPEMRPSREPTNIAIK